MRPPPSIAGPFGPAAKVMSMPAGYVEYLYQAKCGFDVTDHFHGFDELSLYRCEATGMCFWRPESLAGDESFYRGLSAAWDSYYKDWRWEYDLTTPYLRPDLRLLEIGSGEGFFLRHTEGRVREAMGLELNREAIGNKVTSWDIIPDTIESFSQTGQLFDIVCSFQVLEHVTNPRSFIEAALACLRPGGVLVISVPNFRNMTFANRADAFDLPPHHVNHFTDEVFRRIADLYGLTIEKSKSQVRKFALEPVTRTTASKKTYQIARRFAERVFSRIYSAAGEPGHTMLVAFRRRA